MLISVPVVKLISTKFLSMKLTESIELDKIYCDGTDDIEDIIVHEAIKKKKTISNISVEHLKIGDVKISERMEYKKGTIPNSISMPILNDDQHKLVGVDYKKNGADWGGGCKGNNQSPIDLKKNANPDPHKAVAAPINSSSITFPIILLEFFVIIYLINVIHFLILN